MNNDFVWNAIYKGALSQGASDRCASDAAQMGVDTHRKGKYTGKVSKMIESKIKQAVKHTKRSK